MRTKRHIILAVILATFACNISAEETVTLRRITGAELKYLYEFPTRRGIYSGVSEGIDGDFARCPGLSFVIVEKDKSFALPNYFVKEQKAVQYVTAQSVGTEGEYLLLDESKFEDLRFSIIRERQAGSVIKKEEPTVLPMSVLYVNHANTNEGSVDMKGEYNGGAKFNTEITPSLPTHPWIAYDAEDSDRFKLHLMEGSSTSTEITKPWYLQYNKNGDDDRFRLAGTQNEYNLNIYQYENISLEPEVDAVGDVNVAISHVDDDPVMQNLEEGAIEMCVVMNDGSAVSAKDMMESETRYSLYSKDDKSWAESLKIESSPATVVSRAGESASTTVWMQPCYTLNYEGKNIVCP